VFLRLPFHFVTNLQQTVLLINTVILIAALVVVELVYSETTREKRQQLKFFYPLFLVLLGLLVYAAYKQVGKG
jgi:uncharacterized membrane protein SirB2